MVETVTPVSRSFNREIPWAETVTPMSRFSTEALGRRVGGDAVPVGLRGDGQGALPFPGGCFIMQRDETLNVGESRPDGSKEAKPR